MEVTVNVQGLEELKRVLSGVPTGKFNISTWHDCACGHATRDAWFQSHGFTSCYSFRHAASFFEITHKEAIYLFSVGSPGPAPIDVIARIDSVRRQHS
jgi:hypothetical protein